MQLLTFANGEPFSAPSFRAYCFTRSVCLVLFAAICPAASASVIETFDVTLSATAPNGHLLSVTGPLTVDLVSNQIVDSSLRFHHESNSVSISIFSQPRSNPELDFVSVNGNLFLQAAPAGRVGTSILWEGVFRLGTDDQATAKLEWIWKGIPRGFDDPVVEQVLSWTPLRAEAEEFHDLSQISDPELGLFVGTASSSGVVPEPSTYVTWSALGLIGASVHWRRRRKARQSRRESE